jgi:transposase
LKVKHNKATYSQTFKITVVEYVHTHQVSRVQAAAHFGISPSQVNSWIRIVKDQGVTGLRAQRKGRPPMGKHKQIKPIKKLEPTQEEKYKQEILELKSKLHEAELDRDILKALATQTKNSPKHSLRK